ncbi:hypothetical protein FS749_003398 [Ceratobasidium sp. UAMH 11750]|nr:hypothetical protein FS749_003398 [Ceratobasidium sp. UAMH 11750]
MLSKKQLAEISEMISIGKQQEGENNSTKLSGGINVIIAGDFHQFPPVVGVGPSKGALYSPTESSHSVKAMNGEALYKAFKTVVLLKQPFRVQDEEWSRVLT